MGIRGRIAYLLDASVFIEAARRYYAFDIVPSFWSRVVGLAADDMVLTIDRVRNEIEHSHDTLASWLIDDFSHWVVSTGDGDVVQAYKAIIQWVYDPSRAFFDYAKNGFASGADPWLIAYATAHNCCVVTQETYKPGIQRQVPIPNVCREFGVRYLDTFVMMRELSVAI
ncbi:MAG: DUF4411 family protein [Limnochordia bacterium]|nr:DUF4411 family protein [Limnochordia bacterium]